MAEITYTLVVEVTGLNVSEGVAGEKGSAEALKQMEATIRSLNFAAASTNVSVKSLTKD